MVWEELRLDYSKYFYFLFSVLLFTIKWILPTVSSAYQASLIYYLERVGSIFWNNIHYPHIFVFQGSCKWSHICFHVHQVPQSIRLDLCIQSAPVIVNSLLPNFLHHDQSYHIQSSCDHVSVFMRCLTRKCDVCIQKQGDFAMDYHIPFKHVTGIVKIS